MKKRVKSTSRSDLILRAKIALKMSQDRPNMGSKNRSKRREKDIPGDVEKRVEKSISGGGAKILSTPPDRGKKVFLGVLGGGGEGGNRLQT